MTVPRKSSNTGQQRFQKYIQKIATGPQQSKDLSEEEAYDALMLILNGEISPVRSAIFLIAIRMKRETLEENTGIWKALDSTTEKHCAKVEKLLQVAEPFDGFSRTPCFGFYAIPVIAQLGLPCYGHSSLSLPPKHGITFQEILYGHYKLSLSVLAEVKHLEKNGFCFIGLHQSHPKLEALRNLREEMIKRSALATFEKMLMPIFAEGNVNILATTYFHKGYEIPMLAAARLGEFKKTFIGNGLESTTLFGVHKPSTLFTISHGSEVEKERFNVFDLLEKKDAEKIQCSYQELKLEKTELGTLANFGERALRDGTGPAAKLIAWQAGSLVCLADSSASFRDGFQAAIDVLKKGKAYSKLMAYVERRENPTKNS